MAKLLQGSPQFSPINILPDSAFALSPVTDIRHIDNIAAGANARIRTVGVGDSQICWDIQPNAPVSNVDISYSSYTIRIKGTCIKNPRHVSGANFYLFFKAVIWLRPGIMYTAGASCKDNRNIFFTTPNPASGSPNAYYFSPTTQQDKNGYAPYTHVRIFKNSSGMSTGYLVYQMYSENDNDSFDFDFTLYDMFLYEGSCVNPKYYTSMDSLNRIGFIKQDLSNFPSKVNAFNFQQRNSINQSALSNKTFLANKWYDWMLIHTSDTMTGVTNDGIEYINIRGLNFYPDANQCDGNAYEMKIFWHEVSYSSYKGAHPVFIENPLIKRNTVYSGNNIANVASFRLVKVDWQNWKIQWKVGTNNASYVQSWVGEIDVYGRVIKTLQFTGYDTTVVGGTDKWVAYD